MGQLNGVGERHRASLVAGHAITELPEPSPLIDGILDLNSVAALYGPSGAGKSLVALDWALHVAAGRQWWGHKTVPGRVLYVVAEGATGTRYRYEAWCEYHEVERVDDILWMTLPANVLVSTERVALYEIVAEYRPILVVLDTLARHMPGGDENSFQTLSVVVETLDHLKRLTQGTILPVHHSGKDEAQGARGHSSLKGALDAELSVRTTRIDGQMRVQVYAEKFKDREDHKVLAGLRMEHVGRSLVPVYDDAAMIRSIDLQILECLNGQYTPYSDWWRASGVAKSTFSRAQHRLLDGKWIEGNAETGWRRLI